MDVQLLKAWRNHKPGAILRGVASGVADVWLRRGIAVSVAADGQAGPEDRTPGGGRRKERGDKRK